jgi:hypothetical protein
VLLQIKRDDDDRIRELTDEISSIRSVSNFPYINIYVTDEKSRNKANNLLLSEMRRGDWRTSKMLGRKRSNKPGSLINKTFVNFSRNATI